ncbi:ABC transporter permease [Paraburkholderia tropica]|uniref:ABC transporter permease n=1 Tax=Paraburkholderia tropica TaxID=92647 RepID=UPI001CB27A5A|nr:ABC transporter permease [Paraburkholderia tropica]CAG9216615.1 ABC transporter permease [Paraburkholderia tropica]
MADSTLSTMPIVDEAAQAAATQAQREHADRRPNPWLLYVPALVFLAVFFVVPLGYVIYMSVSEPTFGFGNFVDLLGSAHFRSVLVHTFLTSAFVTVCALVCAYPLAYVAATGSAFVSRLMLTVLALSFWTSFLVKTYAWMVILGVSGPLSAILETFGWRPAPHMLFTSFSSTLAMTHALVPFMAMALYAVMKRIDVRLMRAAESLGARPWRAFREVWLPLSAPGIVNGCTLVFITSLGFYVMPALLGSPHDQMISGVVGDQIEQVLDFGMASAMSIVLLVVTLAVFALYHRFVGLDRLWK